MVKGSEAILEGKMIFILLANTLNININNNSDRIHFKFLVSPHQGIVYTSMTLVKGIPSTHSFFPFYVNCS